MAAANGDDTSRAGEVLEDEEVRFRRLFERYYWSIAGFFAKRGLSPEECQDLTQETFLHAYRGMAGFRGETSEATWLFAIAANLWRNEIRRRTAKKRAVESSPLDVVLYRNGGTPPDDSEVHEGMDRPKAVEFPPQEPTPSRIALERERAKLLQEAMANLPPQMRQCLFLRFGQDLKYREIAELMRISLDTVKSHLHQARYRLRQELGHDFPEIDFE